MNHNTPWREHAAQLLCAFGVMVALAGAPGCQLDDSRSNTLSVFAASSLREAFEELGATFEAAHPDVALRFVFAGSQVLRLQIEQGAPADVFASANPEHMAALASLGLVESVGVFAYNQLALIVPAANPSRIKTFSDLRDAERLVVGTKRVPIGKYTRLILGKASALYGSDFQATVESRVVSEESNVRLLRAKVQLGEADAAVVYQTDTTHALSLEVIEIPAELNIRAEYPMGLVARTVERTLASEWLSFVLSHEGQRVLRDHGFVGAS